MTEKEARERVRDLVGSEAVERLGRLAELVIAENERQNLIARSTVPAIWARHILDSVQLLRWGKADGVWLDIGTGGGFPGLVVAIASPRPMILAEPRRRRAAFLVDACRHLHLSNVRVAPTRVEAIPAAPVAVISARAVASIGDVLRSAQHCADTDTCWLLPRGVSCQSDVQVARRQWSGAFHVEQSLSDPCGGIVIASGVVAR